MKLTAFLVFCLVGFTGCDNAAHSTPNTTKPSTAADNTGVNERDRDHTAKTPIDQKENKQDINVTAEIRKRVVASDMSTDAKNVKIITENGRVTLRGPVKTSDEKKKIEAIATDVAGADKVDDQLEIAPAH